MNISITIAGPPILPLGEERNYILRATFHYHNPSCSSVLISSPLPPITFKEAGSPIDNGASLTGTYRLYPLSPPSAEHVEDNWFDFDIDDSPKLVTTANGFTTIRPGENITRELTIVPACFEVKPGVKYVLRMPEGYGRIQWWAVGGMEVFEGIAVRATEWSSDEGLNCGVSNDVEVLAT